MEYLKRLKSQLDCISGNWDGDESGEAEDRSHAADEGVEYFLKF